jgi:hypothetical protein
MVVASCQRLSSLKLRSQNQNLATTSTVHSSALHKEQWPIKLGFKQVAFSAVEVITQTVVQKSGVCLTARVNSVEDVSNASVPTTCLSIVIDKNLVSTAKAIAITVVFVLSNMAIGLPHSQIQFKRVNAFTSKQLIPKRQI